MTARGISRVFEKLENSIKEGRYYEAHQMYRTLYFRYLSQKKYNDLKEMLFKGSMLFLDADQKTSGADIGLLLIEVLVKSEEKNCDEWCPKLSLIFSKIGANFPAERETLLAHSIKWSAQGFSHGSPLLHENIARIYWDERNYAQARHHFIHSKDGRGCGKLLIEFQRSKGYKCEVDLFIAQAVLQLLCLRNKVTASQTFTTYTEQHPRIKRNGPPYLLPLLNFIWFLLQAIESQKLHTFAVLCEQYENSIKRDPCYIQYLDKIGQIFFGVKPPEEKKSGGLFGNFLESFLGGLDEESDEDVAQASTSSRLIENTEMD
ncbi:Golgi to ER traffic protein 4 homolog [Cylas formicarius]|uniref:Golgi to ER traffic protein 4 homolog n=1 Tax=Cylas formicarius TaxID=197179 RepID=UPI002958D79C|nr:Golgi to ER traffic protein 4 homolog [Cylas formicarius]